MVNRILLAILGILIILIIGIFAIGYFALEKEKQILQQKQEKITQEQEIISELCKKYRNFKTGITCEQAANLVLLKYQGEIVSIEKTQIDMPLPPGSEKTSELTDFWAVSINLEESADKLKIMVDTNSGQIKILKQI